MSKLAAIRRSLVDVARRHSRVDHEAEDLAHDVFVSALRRGLPIDDERFARSARAAARQHGAFLARSAARRRARERRAATSREQSLRGTADADAHVWDPVDGDEAGGRPVSVLSPALRTTLQLLMLGLDKAELRLALGLSDAALRKRFQALRDHGPFARPPLIVTTRTRLLAHVRRSQVGLLPRLAKASDRGQGPGRAIATHDPDGHGLVFIEMLTPAHRTATTDAST